MEDWSQVCHAYAQLYAELTPERVVEFEALVSEGIRFRDPFNELTGCDAMQQLLLHMFETTGNPRFEVVEVSVQAEHAWLLWVFSAQVPVLGSVRVEGSTRLVRDPVSGRVAEHLDYWDSAPFYLRLPLLGALLRWVKKRIQFRPNR